MEIVPLFRQAQRHLTGSHFRRRTRLQRQFPVFINVAL